MPVYNAARAASLAMLVVASLTMAACQSGSAPARRTTTSAPVAAPSAAVAEAAIGRTSDPGHASDPVPGEFRLGPGNQQPPGVVIPPTQKSISSGPVPGEFRLGPGNQQPPGVVVPLD